MIIKKIISGAQTRVGRATLDFASKKNTPNGRFIEEGTGLIKF